MHFAFQSTAGPQMSLIFFFTPEGNFACFSFRQGVSGHLYLHNSVEVVGLSCYQESLYRFSYGSNVLHQRLGSERSLAERLRRG